MTIDIFNILPGSGNSLIPPRDPNAITGSSFIQQNMNIKGLQREHNIMIEILSGNIPNFLRNFSPIHLAHGSDVLSILVMSDYLSIGSDDDYVRMPMGPHTAQAIADKFDCTLPTRQLVNNIWQAAANKLEPKPWGPPFDETMSDTYRYGVHSNTIRTQLVGLDFRALTAGHKKDVVLTNYLYPNNPNRRVAIYGWIYPNGQVIQALNPVSHDDQYADYSHGIRLIANDVIVNGQAKRITDLFMDPSLAPLVSDEGVLNFTRY